MSIIICPECGKKVSDKANVCPHCGYPIGNRGNDFISKISLSDDGIVLEDSLSEESGDDDKSVANIECREETIHKDSKKKVLGIVIIISAIVAIILGVVLAGTLKNSKEKNDVELVAEISMMLGKEIIDGKPQLSTEQEELASAVKMFGINGFLTLVDYEGDDNIVTTVFFEPNEILSEEEYNKVFEELKKIFGDDFEAFENDEYTKYEWYNTEGFTAIALGMFQASDGNRTFVAFQNLDLSVEDSNETSVETDEYGVEQMVGYDSLVALPIGSPVTVSGVANEVAQGIYVMEIFTKDLDEIDANNMERKAIYVLDGDVSVSYDKRYISVDGHTESSDSLPIVIAERITDESDEYIASGGILPE